MNLVVKAPKQCTSDELLLFKQIVEKGGEVQLAGLENRIADALQLVVLYVNGLALGTSAIKAPDERYRNGIFEKAGVKHHASRFSYELGWVFVVEHARGNHYSSHLTQAALNGLKGEAVFATTSETNERMQKTLKKFGFSQLGNSYLGRHNRRLVLFTRDS